MIGSDKVLFGIRLASLALDAHVLIPNLIASIRKVKEVKMSISS